MIQRIDTEDNIKQVGPALTYLMVEYLLFLVA